MQRARPTRKPLWDYNKKRSRQACSERDCHAVLGYNCLHAVSICARLEASWNHTDEGHYGHARRKLSPDSIYTAEPGVADWRQGDPFGTISSLQSSLAALKGHEHRSNITKGNGHGVRWGVCGLSWLNPKEYDLGSDRIVAPDGQQNQQRKRSRKVERST
jgi:hypothetical protein